MTRPAYLQALTAHARHVPSGTREAFAAAAADAVARSGGVLVRTCHRVEVYVAARDVPSRLPALPPGGAMFHDEDAARHLLAVATGADSVVVAEDQVLGQLRENVAAARGSARLDPLVERLFQEALAAGRRARAWRQTPPRSLADVALDRIEERAGRLAGRLVLVVGAGTMGRLTALAGRRRGARLTIASRTGSNAGELARRVGGSVTRFAGPIDPETIAVVVAVRGRWPLPVLPASVELVVDLSSPPALLTDEAHRLGPRLIAADDLAVGPAADPDRRLRRRLETAIDEGTAAFVRWVRARDTVPTIQALRESAEARRADELRDLWRRMPELDPNERALVDRMSRRLVAGILHEPLRRLHDDEDGERARAARAIFGL